VVLSEMQIHVRLRRRAMPVAVSGLKSEWLQSVASLLSMAQPKSFWNTDPST
jgi:hypothetical protein